MIFSVSGMRGRGEKMSLWEAGGGEGFETGGLRKLRKGVGWVGIGRMTPVRKR